MFTIDFDKRRFGSEEISERVLATGYSWIPGAVGHWWDRICLENTLDAKEKKLQNFLYYFIEIARNAQESVEKGTLKVMFDTHTITVVVEDGGEGFPDAESVKYAIDIEHGLWQVKRYSDTFILETNGKKYQKVKGQKYLVESSDTDVQHGTRVTFSKVFLRGLPAISS